ncbi:unnamed protein product, partial [Rotaria sp. Silwood1]
TYHSAPTSTLTVNSTSKDLNRADVSPKAAPIKKITHTYDNTFKSFAEPNSISEPSFPFESSYQVLQSAKNEKIKLIPNFSGSENFLNWLNNLQQIGKSLKLSEQQIYELATIKLSGPAQEWFYHQDEIDNWSSFKEAFLYAFPPPIQPTNIDYLAQLLARKQGETEPVGKFVQDINRLCLKLDNKISEQDKLQYLRRSLRPQLKHYALSITSLQDLLTVMQRHEQIEKETTSNQQSSSRSSQQLQLLNRPDRNNYNHQQNNHSTYYESPDYYYRNSHAQTSAQQQANNYLICYQYGGASVNYIHYPSPLHFIHVPVNNRIMEVLVDTGATNSIIQQASLANIQHQQFYPVQQQFFLANKTSISIIGYVTLEIKIQHIRTYVTAAVTKTLCCDLILGEDWIKYYRATIDRFKDRLEILGNKAAISLQPSSIIPNDKNYRVNYDNRYYKNYRVHHGNRYYKSYKSIPNQYVPKIPPS